MRLQISRPTGTSQMGVTAPRDEPQISTVKLSCKSTVKSTVKKSKLKKTYVQLEAPGQHVRIRCFERWPHNQ